MRDAHWTVDTHRSLGEGEDLDHPTIWAHMNVRQAAVSGWPDGVLTLHRPSNVDGDRLEPVMESLNEIGREIPLVSPVHPRTGQRLRNPGLSFEQSVLAIEPLGYRDFLGLLDASTVALTDSGGVQEEA